MSVNTRDLWTFARLSAQFCAKTALISFTILEVSSRICAATPCEVRADAHARETQAALFDAMNHGDTPTALRLIEGGLDVNANDRFCKTPLHWAAQWGRLEIVQALIKAGANVNARDQQGYTPLVLAYQFGHLNVLQPLLEAGADRPEVPNLNPTPEKGWQTYVDGTYKVALRFPSAWKRDPEIYQDRPYFSSDRKALFFDYNKWHGQVIHSFQILVMGDESTTPEAACKGEAEHVLKPYGDNPAIRQMKVDGQKACLIFPSKGQGPAAYAGAFVKYPEPVEIEGDRYSILALYADNSYLSDMVEGLHFIYPGHRNPPFVLTIAPAQTGNLGSTWKNDAGFPLLLTMRNTSDKVLHVALADPASDYRVIAMHKTERARVTVSLPGMNEESQGVTASTRNTAKILKPNETCQDTIQVKFWADRMATGEYTLQVERDLPLELGKGLLESNTITVIVTDSEAAH